MPRLGDRGRRARKSTRPEARNEGARSIGRGRSKPSPARRNDPDRRGRARVRDDRRAGRAGLRSERHRASQRSRMVTNSPSWL